MLLYTSRSTESSSFELQARKSLDVFFGATAQSTECRSASIHPAVWLGLTGRRRDKSPHCSAPSPGGAGSPPIMMVHLGRGQPCAKWHLESRSIQGFGQGSLAGRKPSLQCPFLWGVQSPPNTISHGLRSTFVPSGISIHPAVLPGLTCVTDRQTDFPTAKARYTSVPRPKA